MVCVLMAVLVCFHVTASFFIGAVKNYTPYKDRTSAATHDVVSQSWRLNQETYARAPL